MDLPIGQDDLLPPLQVQLQDVNGVVPDLTGKTVTCRVRHATCGAVSETTLGAGDILDAKDGYVQHSWVAPETARPGLLLVTFHDGEITYPPGRYYHVRVTPKL